MPAMPSVARAWQSCMHTDAAAEALPGGYGVPGILRLHDKKISVC